MDNPVHPQVSGRLAAAGITDPVVLRDNGKAVTVSAQWRMQHVVAKLLTTDDPHWVARHQLEQHRYRQFISHPPPIRIPPLLYTEPGLTILGRVDGVMLSADRYPRNLDTEAAVRALLALDALHRWRPTAGVLGDPQPITTRYVDRLAHAAGLNNADRRRIDQLLACGPWPFQAQHGDVWASNILIGDEVAFVDLEHMGFHVPGYDLAQVSLMWAVDHPQLDHLVAQRVQQQNIQVPYALNMILLACREWDIHRRDGGASFAEARSVLQANLHAARECLHGRPLPITVAADRTAPGSSILSGPARPTDPGWTP